MTTNRSLSALTPSSAKMMAQAEKVIDSGKYDEAILIYNEIIDREPTAYVFAKRGFAKYENERYESAVEDFDRAIALKPDSPITLRYRAKSKEFLGALDEALRDYRASLAFRNRAETHSDIAMILEYQGRTADAINEFGLALEIDPEDEFVKNSLDELLK